MRRGEILVKRFGNRYKLVEFKSNASGGVAGVPRLGEDEQGNDKKLAQSISRTRSRIYELASCNPWEYFVTLTLDGARRDRFDLDAFRKDFSQYLRNVNRIKGWDVRYLLIPETHKDGAWHMHGLIFGLPDSALSRNANGYLDWNGYSDRFGYMSLSKIRSAEAVSAYVTKYITKDVAARAHELGKHLFFSSKGLQSAEEIGVFREARRDALQWDYEGDWTKVLWLNKEEFDNVLAHSLR